MNIRYRVTLTADERLQLETMIQRGKVAVRKIKRAQVLLAADQGSTVLSLARCLDRNCRSISRTFATCRRVDTLFSRLEPAHGSGQAVGVGSGRPPG